MMVSLIQSNYRGMGSGLVADGLGFMFQDRGELFALEPGHPNVYAPGKRPFQTIIPAFVMKDGKPFMSFGVMGGDMQPQGHVQIVVNMIDFGLNVQEAGDAARFHHEGSEDWSRTDSGGVGTLELETGIAPDVRDELDAPRPQARARRRRLRRLSGDHARPRNRRLLGRDRNAQRRRGDGLLTRLSLSDQHRRLGCATPDACFTFRIPFPRRRSHLEGSIAAAVESSIRVRLLGRMTISRDGEALELPASRKLLALFAYLSLSPRAVARTQLCELLWDVPNDPRGALRWCLSKIRRILDDPERRRVQTPSDAVQFDLSDCFVDAIEVLRTAEGGIEQIPSERLRELLLLFDGDFLEGLEIDRAPIFNGWLTAERRRFRGCRATLLEHLVNRVPDEQALEYLDKWLQIAPFDRRVHEKLLGALVRCNRIREAEAHLDTTTQAFADEGLDVAPIREAWRAARAHSAPAGDIGTVAPQVARASELIVAPGPRRASIAVMPFVDDSVVVSHAHGSALAHDVITRLAQLRSLFVIAQGTVFALHDRRIGPEEAGRMLNVDYVVSGAVRRELVSHAVRRDARLIVSVELAETRSARIVWAEEFRHEPHDAFMVLDEIGNRIVASIASEIETVERNRAILKPPNSLDAWEAHHRGLWHMYRFTKPDNERAVHFFQMAVQLDPTFARAFAGLSLAHFQNAFQRWVDREPESDLAYDAAGKSLMVDDRDPAAHWAMGRALWLRGRLDQSVSEHERTIDLSPNFAMGHYSLSFVHAQGGDPHVAITSSDSARELSPFDPLLFGMFGTRAMALVRLGRFDEAAEWAVKGAARVNAHPHVLGMAALCLALAGSLDEARPHVAAIRKTLPSYSVDDFLDAFQFGPEDAAMFRKGAKRIGLS